MSSSLPSDRFRVIIIQEQIKAAVARAPDKKNLLLEDFLFVLDAHEKEAQGYDTLVKEQQSLQAEHADLHRQHQELEQNHSALQMDYEILKGEFADLQEQYENLEEMQDETVL